MIGTKDKGKGVELFYPQLFQPKADLPRGGGSPKGWRGKENTLPVKQ